MKALLALMKALDCLPHMPKLLLASLASLAKAFRFSHLSFGGGQGLTRVIFTRGTSVGLPLLPTAAERNIK